MHGYATQKDDLQLRLRESAAGLQRADQKTGGGFRQIVVQIMGDVGMIAIQTARRGFVAIALLGHGQADDMRGRRGHRVQHGLRILGRDQHVAQDGHDLRGLAVRAQFHRLIGPALRLQPVTGAG